MDIDLLLKPLGILTYFLLLATLLGGLKRVKLQYHKILAFTTLAVASLHGGLIVYLTYLDK
jgi:hypothetical protein